MSRRAAPHFTKGRNLNMNNGKYTVFIPKRGRNDNERYVAVNGKRMLIRCGEAVTVPYEFKEIIEQSQRQDRMSDAYIAENRKDD